MQVRLGELSARLGGELIGQPDLQIDRIGTLTSATPSTKNCTPVTPTLSEAPAVTGVVPDTLAPPVGDVMPTVGAVVSGG